MFARCCVVPLSCRHQHCSPLLLAASFCPSRRVCCDSGITRRRLTAPTSHPRECLSETVAGVLPISDTRVFALNCCTCTWYLEVTESVLLRLIQWVHPPRPLSESRPPTRVAGYMTKLVWSASSCRWMCELLVCTAVICSPLLFLRQQY